VRLRARAERQVRAILAHVVVSGGCYFRSVGRLVAATRLRSCAASDVIALAAAALENDFRPHLRAPSACKLLLGRSLHPVMGARLRSPRNGAAQPHPLTVASKGNCTPGRPDPRINDLGPGLKARG